MVKCYTKERRRYFKEVFFSASNSFQEWTVPANTTSVHVTVVGAKGRNGKSVGGAGGKVECDLEVTPGDTLYVYAGLMNTTGTVTYTASDIRTNNTGITDTTSLNSRIIVAGAGGNGSDGDRNYFYQGGAGGGLTGGAGANARNAAGGGGGTQSSGGSSYTSSGTTGSYGTFGLGGNGSAASAGGAGWYGGGGGSTNGHNAKYWHSGGGGGSSYTDSTLCTNVVHTQGANPDGDGYVKIKYESDETDYTEFVTEGVAYQGIYNASTLVYYKDYVFNVSNSIQSWTVPNNIRKVHAVVVGSKGASSEIDPGSTVGGYGGKVECDLDVTPGENLYIVVGKIPENAATVTYNASDIRTNNAGITNEASLRSRIIVAGGGGSGAWRRGSGNGGAGGGLTGSNGVSATYASGGAGGSQSSGGTGGTVNIGGSRWGSPGGNGSLGLGGTSNNHSYQYAIGGVGGAGYYGGGGGAGVHTSNINNAAGGGGGSSYTDSNLCTNVVHTRGAQDGEGYVMISIPGTPEDYTRVVDLGYECKLWKSSTGAYNTIHVNPTNERYTLTVTPTPASATVTLTCEGETQQGNSITTQARKMVRYEVSKEGYETKTGLVYMDSDQTLLVSLKQYCTLTLNTTPNDADVIFTIGSISYDGSNEITVIEGTEVSYTVSKLGYTTVNGSTTVNSTKSIAVSLEPVYVTLTINPTPNDATVVLTATGYTQSGNTITVLQGTEVTYSVSKTGYTTQSDTIPVNATNTMNVTLVQNGIPIYYDSSNHALTMGNTINITTFSGFPFDTYVGPNNKFSSPTFILSNNNNTVFKIISISGTIGRSGSKITTDYINSHNINEYYTYQETKVINNQNVHMYIESEGLPPGEIFVKDNFNINDTYVGVGFFVNNATIIAKSSNSITLRANDGSTYAVPYYGTW